MCGTGGGIQQIPQFPPLPFQGLFLLRCRGAVRFRALQRGAESLRFSQGGACGLFLLRGAGAHLLPFLLTGLGLLTPVLQLFPPLIAGKQRFQLRPPGTKRLPLAALFPGGAFPTRCLLLRPTESGQRFLQLGGFPAHRLLLGAGLSQ